MCPLFLSAVSFTFTWKALVWSDKWEMKTWQDEIWRDLPSLWEKKETLKENSQMLKGKRDAIRKRRVSTKHIKQKRNQSGRWERRTRVLDRERERKMCIHRKWRNRKTLWLEGRSATDFRTNVCPILQFFFLKTLP